MSKISLLNTYLVISLLGLVDASYLTYTRMLGITPPCNLGAFSDCATVAKSSYSVLFGIPLSVYGMVFYGFALLLVLLTLSSKIIPHFREALLTTSILGALSSIYFLYIQGYIIKAFCIYCITSAVCTFILLLLSIIIHKKTKTA